MNKLGGLGLKKDCRHPTRTLEVSVETLFWIPATIGSYPPMRLNQARLRIRPHVGWTIAHRGISPARNDFQLDFMLTASTPVGVSRKQDHPIIIELTCQGLFKFIYEGFLKTITCGGYRAAPPATLPPTVLELPAAT